MVQKYELIFGCTLIFFIVLNILPILAQCEKDVDVYYQFKIFREDQPLTSSGYKYPNCKEDDFLQLWKFTVINRANCTYPKSYLKFIITTPTKINDNPFGKYKFEIPELKPKENYSLSFSSFSNTIYCNKSFPVINYINSNGTLYPVLYSPVQLKETGPWKSELKLEEADPYLRLGGSIGSSLSDDEGNILSKDFKVLSKTELEDIETNRLNFTVNLILLVVSCCAILVSGLSVFIQIWLAKSAEKILRETGEKQIKELKNVGNYIQHSAEKLQYSVEKQLEESKKFEEGKRKNIINSLLAELKANKEIAKSILKMKQSSHEEKQYTPTSYFMVNNLHLAISSYSIQDEKLNEHLYILLNNLTICNNLIKINMFGLKTTVQETLKKLFEDTRMSLDIIESVISEIEVYLSK